VVFGLWRVEEAFKPRRGHFSNWWVVCRKKTLGPTNTPEQRFSNRSPRLHTNWRLTPLLSSFSPDLLDRPVVRGWRTHLRDLLFLVRGAVAPSISFHLLDNAVLGRETFSRCPLSPMERRSAIQEEQAPALIHRTWTSDCCS
jgi:hypothetical protein